MFLNLVKDKRVSRLLGPERGIFLREEENPVHAIVRSQGWADVGGVRVCACGGGGGVRQEKPDG